MKAVLRSVIHNTESMCCCCMNTTTFNCYALLDLKM